MGHIKVNIDLEDRFHIEKLKKLNKEELILLMKSIETILENTIK